MSGTLLLVGANCSSRELAKSSVQCSLMMITFTPWNGQLVFLHETKHLVSFPSASESSWLPIFSNKAMRWFALPPSWGDKGARVLRRAQPRRIRCDAPKGLFDFVSHSMNFHVQFFKRSASNKVYPLKNLLRLVLCGVSTTCWPCYPPPDRARSHQKCSVN